MSAGSRTPLSAVVVVSCLWCVTSAASAQRTTNPDEGAVTVLFIGSSYFEYADMPGIFDALAKASGRHVLVRRELLSGHYLDYFAHNAGTEKAIAEQPWDYVILQGGTQNVAYPDTHHQITPNSAYHPVYPALETLKTKVRANSADTKIVYMMPWAFEDGMTWVEGQTDSFQDMQLKIHANTLRWADSLDLAVAPVGWAWNTVLQDNPPIHHLHSADWNHPNFRGSYLGACVILATLLGETVEGITYYGLLDRSDAEHLQQVAAQTVLDSLDLWNIIP